MIFDNLFEYLFGTVVESSPLVGLLLISFILTLGVTLVYKYMTDQELLKSLKKEMKEIRDEIKEFKDNPQKVMELQKKQMSKSLTQTKNTFKPMLITMIPLIFVFTWLKKTYTDIEVSFIGISSWFWIYFIFAIVFSISLRKILKVH